MARRSCPRSLILSSLCLVPLLLSPSKALYAQDEEAPSRQRNKELWPIFSYKNQSDERRLTVLWPLYESRRDEEGSALFLRPFFGHEQSSLNDSEYWSFMWPLLASSKDQDRSHSRVLPFFWQTRSEQERRRIIAPFYYGYRNEAEDRSQAFLAPNFWYQRHGEARSWHVFPFVGYGEDGLRKKHWSALYPLFRGEKDESLGRSRYDIFWPLGGYRNDEFLGSYSWSPVHYHEANADGSSSLYLPFYGAKRFGPSRKSSGLFPLYYSSDHGHDPESRDLYTLLFQRSVHDSGRSSFSVLPFYYQSGGGDSEASTTYSPFFYRRSGENSALWIPPFYFGGQSQNSQYRHFAPFYWSTNDTITGAALKLFAPFYYKREKAHSQSSAILPFFYYGGTKSGDSRYFVAAPFYWSQSDASKNRTRRLLFPLYWSDKSDTQANSIYGPFVYTGMDYASKREYLHVAPFYWSGQSEGSSYRGLLPFYWNQQSKSKSMRIIGPVLSGSKNNGADQYFHVAPFYWSGQDQDSSYQSLLPFYWRSSQGPRKQTFIAPFYWSGQSPSRTNMVVGPVLMGSREATQSQYLHILPFYYSSQEGDKAKSSALIPFYWHSQNEERRDGVYSPFVYAGQNQSDSSRYFHVAPFYWSGQKGENSAYRLIAPFYWSHRDGDEERSFMLPFFYQKSSATSKSSLIPPFYWRSKDGAKTNTAYGPFVFHGENTETNERSLGIAPFYWHSEQGDESVAPITTATTVVAPFFYHKETETRKDWAVAPFIFHGENKKNGDSYLHLPPLYWSSKSGDESQESRLFVPLYFNQRDGSSSIQSILGLAWSWKNGDSSSFGLFPNIYLETEGQGDDRTLDLTVFPFIGYENKASTKSLSVLWPFLKHTSREDGYQSWMIPLYYGEKTGEEHLHIAPFYWDAQSEEGRTLHLWPFLAYERDNEGGRAYSTLWPMLSYEVGPNRSAFYVRPFYTHLRTESRSINALYPFFYRRQSLEQESVVGQRFWFLWPLFDRRSTSTETVASSFFYGFRHEYSAGLGTHSQFLWRLYSYEHNEVENSTKFNAFYGLFYREKSPELSKLKFRPLFSYETYTNHGGGDYVSFLSGVFSYERFGTDTPEDSDDYRKIRLFGLTVKTIH